jgi:hypothetical protein
MMTGLDFIRGAVVGAVVLTMVPLQGALAAPACSGEYSSDYGVVRFTMHEGKCVGGYTDNWGKPAKIVGTISRSGRLTGYDVHTKGLPSARCRDTIEGSHFWSRIEFSFEWSGSDYKGWRGRWVRCDGRRRGTWNGHR